jgi:hypothetical protein
VLPLRNQLDGRRAATFTTIRPMRRTRHDIFAKATTPRYIVIWDLHWQVIEVQRLEPASDLYDALMATVERLKRDGWQIEGAIDYGFTFARRDGERRLLALTKRDPADTGRQAFSPF